mmetsp:Transcript_41133/g.72252  ORF Transcript_41133/g.72252 Transcript_41133/m.72252 type:complete len:158 (+) Transcript_41133:420-893(+)
MTARVWGWVSQAAWWAACSSAPRLTAVMEVGAAMMAIGVATMAAGIEFKAPHQTHPASKLSIPHIYRALALVRHLSFRIPQIALGASSATQARRCNQAACWLLEISRPVEVSRERRNRTHAGARTPALPAVRHLTRTQTNKEKQNCRRAWGSACTTI